MRAREITIAASLALHAVVGWGALHAAHEKKLRRATTVAIADEKKKEARKPEPPKPPPPPPPKAKPAAPKPTAAPAPEPVAAPTAAPVTAPIASDIAMTNEIGMDPGGGRVRDEGKPVPRADDKKPKPAAAPHDKPLHVDAPPPRDSAAGACTEPAGKPEPTMKTEIEYTQDARAAGVEGRLVLEVTVDADGNVTAVKVISSVEPALDAAAIATVKTWRFKPALACGKPVGGGVYRIARRFELSD